MQNFTLVCTWSILYLFIDVQDAPAIYNFKNIKEKRGKTIAAIWYSTTKYVKSKDSLPNTYK